MQRATWVMVSSGILLGLAIVALPHQFLFSKVVPNSWWTAYFFLPFGAGWFIAFAGLAPVVWLNRSLGGAGKGGLMALLFSILVAVPCSLSLNGGSLSWNHLFNQYLWVGLVCVPPFLAQLVMKWLAIRYSPGLR